MSIISENNRYIDITDTLRVGYDFLKSQFYATNKETTTYREDVSHIQEVLQALGIHDIPDTNIQALKDNMEVVTNIYYTWEDTGAYIKSIQFNDFKDYPIILDCEKAKIYIENSTVLYDLTTNESPKIVRVPRLCSFYRDILGLTVSKNLMLAIYNLLISYYNPCCYNHIAPRIEEQPLKYNNMFTLSNYSNTAYTTYTCTANPFNTYNPDNIGDIISINNNFSTITLIKPIPQETIDKYFITTGTSLIISNANVEELGDIYSADGTYTIESIEDNIITVNEDIPVSYSFPYPECYVESANLVITKMSREERTITLEYPPLTILVGDTIYVNNADVTTDYETISCNGTYTVQSIENNVLTVSEEIPTDFTGNATLTKEVFISNIIKIAENTIYLQEKTEITLQGATIIVYNNSIKTSYEVISQDIDNGTLTVNSIEDYTPVYPTLQFPVPSEEISVNVEYTDERFVNIFPTGEFITDNFEQAKSYIETFSRAIAPTESTKDNLYNYVPNNIELSVKDEESRVLELKGLYKEVYSA